MKVKTRFERGFRRWQADILQELRFTTNCSLEEKTDELSAILRNEEAQDDFWNLCKSYAEIGMNAPKYRTHGTCEVQGVFQYTDVDNAKDNTVAFIRKYSINGKEDFLILLRDCMFMRLNLTMPDIVGWSHQKRLLWVDTLECIIILHNFQMIYLI